MEHHVTKRDDPNKQTEIGFLWRVLKKDHVNKFPDKNLTECKNDIIYFQKLLIVKVTKYKQYGISKSIELII